MKLRRLAGHTKARALSDRRRLTARRRVVRFHCADGSVVTSNPFEITVGPPLAIPPGQAWPSWVTPATQMDAP